MCAKNKVKIAKGIVKAIHTRGGRFLKLDERTGVYSELENAGKQGAVEKTSQALREKQRQIRAYELSRGDIPKTQFSDEEFYQYSLHVFASIHGEPSDLSELPTSVKEMVEISNLEAISGARSEADRKAPVTPVSSRHAMTLATERDQFPGVDEPDKPRKHRMPSTEPPSKTRKQKKARITVEPITVEPGQNDCLCGRGGRSNHHPGNVFFRQETLKYREWYEQVRVQVGLHTTSLHVFWLWWSFLIQSCSRPPVLKGTKVQDIRNCGRLVEIQGCKISERKRRWRLVRDTPLRRAEEGQPSPAGTTAQGHSEKCK